MTTGIQPRRPLRPDIRIGDVERDQVCNLLVAHYEAGRLSHDEWSERTSAALQAQRQSELMQIMGDLPRIVLRSQLPTFQPMATPHQHHDIQQRVVIGVVEVMVAAVAICAAICWMLMMAMLSSDSGGYATVAFLGTMAGSAVTGALVHFGHRRAKRHQQQGRG